MITLRIQPEVLASVIDAALKRSQDLTATERWNIALLSNVAAEAILREHSEVEPAPI